MWKSIETILSVLLIYLSPSYIFAKHGYYFNSDTQFFGTKDSSSFCVKLGENFILVPSIGI